LEQKVDIAKAKAAALVGVVEGAGVPVQMVGQKEVEVVWAGPASVREQRTERRVPIGHRGSGMRKMLFADSDEDVSDGINGGSGSGGEGECSRAESRAEIRARQRSAIIRQDTTEVKRRAAARLVRRSLPEDSDVAVALVVEMESKREEEMKRRRETEVAEVAAAKMTAANVQSMRKLQVWEWRQHVQSQKVWVRRFFLGWAWGWERQQGRQRRLRGINEVRLFRAACVFIGLKRPFQLWNRWCRNAVSDRIWCGCAVRDILVLVEFWELGMAWRQWKFWMGVHRAEEVLRRFGVERTRGATRQWVSNLWCPVCSSKMVAVAKAATTIEAAAKIAVDAADATKAAADAAKTAAMAKATEEITSDVKLFRIYDGHGQRRYVTEAELWALSKVLVGNFGN
jgi:hypothetical protein